MRDWEDGLYEIEKKEDVMKEIMRKIYIGIHTQIKKRKRKAMLGLYFLQTTYKQREEREIAKKKQSL